MEFPVRLENIFFPHQEVRANPAHDVAGNREGSKISLNHTLSAIEGRDNAFGVEMTIALDEDNSENPPYFFTISAFAILGTDKSIEELETADKQKIEIMAVQILVGSIRERLASITARSPWGGFNLGIIPITPPSHPQDQ